MTKKQTTQELWSCYRRLKKTLADVQKDFYPRIREILQICTDFGSGKNVSITDVQLVNDVTIQVFVGSCGIEDGYYSFPAKYLDMTLDEIKEDHIREVEHQTEEMRSTISDSKIVANDKFAKYRKDQATFLNFLHRIRHICAVIINAKDMEDGILIDPPILDNRTDYVHATGTIAYSPEVVTSLEVEFPFSFVDNASDEALEKWINEIIENQGVKNGSTER